jgi:uncharacterized protein YbjT (DUF2867 family)
MCGAGFGLQACKEAGVPKLIHVSALLANELSPSDWLRRKAQGEQAVSNTPPSAALPDARRALA